MFAIVLAAATLGGSCTERPRDGQPLNERARAQSVPTALAPESTADPNEAEADALRASPTESAMDPFTAAEGMMLPGEGGFTHEVLLEAIATARPTQFKPVGSTSVVFRMKTDSDHTAAFKARSRRRARAPDAEIAAYRIGALLGLDNVVPAAARSVSRPHIANRLHRDFTDPGVWEEIEGQILWNNANEAEGAAIYWVPSMENIGLDLPRERARWRGWVGAENAEPPEGHQALARDLSNMVLFDYLIANWDRYSGGNLNVTGPSQAFRTVLRDHDAAFAAPLPPPIAARLREELEHVTHFSRTVVERLRRLDEGSLQRAMEVEGRASLLKDAQRAGVLERAATAVSYLGSLIDQKGEPAVLSFE